MKQYFSVLQSSPLFAGMEEADISTMMSCLQAKERRFQKGEYVFRQGDCMEDIPILVQGCLHIQREDYWGSRSILSRLGPGDMFGEAYAAPDSGPLRNDIAAVEDSVVLFFEVRRLLGSCGASCPCRSQAVQNLLFALCGKNRTLVQKLGYLSQRTTRDKLMSYLSDEAARQNSASFSIPFNRQQLADYLAVDRSALSAELGRLRDAGLLDFRKNRFTLLGERSAGNSF